MAGDVFPVDKFMLILEAPSMLRPPMASAWPVSRAQKRFPEKDVNMARRRIWGILVQENCRGELTVWRRVSFTILALLSCAAFIFNLMICTQPVWVVECLAKLSRRH